MSRLVRVGLAPAAVLVVALGVAGCGLTGGATSGGASGAASTTAAAPASGQPSTQATPADPSASGGSAPLGDVFATRTGAFGKTKVTLQLYPVQRDGTVSHVNVVLSSPAPGTEGQVAEQLGDRNPKLSDSTYDSADGIELVDGKNAKVYLVASDGSGTCLCSRGLSNVFLKENVPQLFTATFAAPPADVTTVDVIIPTFGTVKGVPVQ